MKKYSIIIIIILSCLNACSDFLVQEPDQQVSIREQFATREGVLQTVNGLYYMTEAVLSNKVYFYPDLIGGNLSFTPNRTDYTIEVPPAMDIDQIYSFRDLESDSDMKYFYTDAYEVINAANIIIEQIAGHDSLSSDEINQITAEALATRVFFHYMLTLVYAQNMSYTPDGSHPGIIYNTRTLIAGVDYPSRSTVAETYSLMKTDLETALLLFTGQPALDYGPGYSYFNEINTEALLARIALQMNDWETARKYADLVITTSGTELTLKDSLFSEWARPEEPVSEVLLEFSIPRTSEGEASSSIGYEYFSYTNSTTYNELCGSGDLLALYDTNDLRRALFREQLLPTSVNGIVGEQPYYFTWKFQDNPGTLAIRLSEMYLIRAEALARLETGTDQAWSDLNEIRTRAGLAAAGDTTDLLEEIFLERRRELAFEGFLLYDIARFHKDITRNDGCISSVCNLSYPSDYFVLPIPESSISLNENMEQNEGY